MLFLLGFLGCGDAPPPPAPTPVPAPIPKPAPDPKPTAGFPETIDWRLPTEVAKTPVPSKVDYSGVRPILETAVQDYGRDPTNPWAVSHALIALGPLAVLSNGKSAVDYLFAEYATWDGDRVVFPRKRGAIRIEPHTDLILKALTEVGIRPDRVVQVQGKPATVGDLYKGSLHRAWVRGERVSFDSWNDTPWALQSLATWAPEELAWTAAGGKEMSMDRFTGSAVDKLVAETKFMRQAMAAGQPVQKRGQGIFAYTCGGAHMLQGTAYAVARGYGEPRHRKALQTEVDVLFWRLDLELQIVDEAIAKHPDYALILLVQRLKFTGHFLESTHKLAALGLFEPTPAQVVAMERAGTELVASVQRLKTMGAYDRMPEVRKAQEQTYLDLIGDSAHALRGIDIATGADGIRR